VNTPPLRRKRTPEEAEFLVETRKLDAAVFAMLQAGEISGNHRDAASHRLIEARLLAEKGHLGEARQRVVRVAALVAQWRKDPPGNQV
jgi:hypothetical protein